MQITLKMFGDLRQYLPQQSGFHDCTLDVPETAMVSDALQHVSLPENKTYLLMRGGELVLEDDYTTTALKPGDEIVLFPPVKGG